MAGGRNQRSLLVSVREHKHKYIDLVRFKIAETKLWKSCFEDVKLTELVSFEARICEDFKGTRASSAPATTKTGRSPMDFNRADAF